MEHYQGNRYLHVHYEYETGHSTTQAAPCACQPYLCPEQGYTRVVHRPLPLPLAPAPDPKRGRGSVNVLADQRVVGGKMLNYGGRGIGRRIAVGMVMSMYSER